MAMIAIPSCYYSCSSSSSSSPLFIPIPKIQSSASFLRSRFLNPFFPLSFSIFLSRSLKPKFPSPKFRMIRMSWDGPLSAVPLTVQAENLELSDSLRSYVEEKLGKAILKHSQLVTEVVVRLFARFEQSRGSNRGRCEVTLSMGYGMLWAEKDAVTIYASIDLACSDIRRRLRKIKMNQTGQVRDGHLTAFAAGMDEEEEEDDDIEGFHASHVEGPPLTVDKALEQFEKADEDYYSFRNSETGELNLLCKGRYGGYTLLVLKEDRVEVEPLPAELTKQQFNFPNDSEWV